MFEIKEIKRPVCISVANRIIERLHAQNEWRQENGMPKIAITGALLQKLIYLCVLTWLIDNEDCDMILEDFKAWSRGPVIPELYDYFTVYNTDSDLWPILKKDNDYILSVKERKFINRLVDNVCDIPLETLIEYTQIEGSPWKQVYDSNLNTKNSAIVSKNNIKKWIRNSNNQDNLAQFILNGRFNTQEQSNVLKKNLHK